MIISYLRRSIRIILLLALCAGVFALIFYLYDLPAEAILYAFFLCLSVAAAFFIAGLKRHAARHRELCGMKSSIATSCEHLPEPRDLIEKDYQALIEILYHEKARIESEADGSRRDLVDYFTLWAHQIKTPISAMRLMLQAEEPPGSAALSAELFRIEQYVDMALQYIRLDSPTTDLVIRRCSLDAVVRQAVRKYSRLFILKKLRLDFRESGLYVLSDEKWLRFVLEQVLDNALKYTCSGGVSICAAGRALVIEDTGIGIKPEDLPRIFEKGFTGYNGREDKKSTGLGLYLCRRVMDMLGHSISVESEPGRGTRVLLGFKEEKALIE